MYTAQLIFYLLLPDLTIFKQSWYEQVLQAEYNNCSWVMTQTVTRTISKEAISVQAQANSGGADLR